MTVNARVIICTGAPGNGRDELLEEMHETTAFHYHHLFDYIVEEARVEGTILTKINILDFYHNFDDQYLSSNTYHLYYLYLFGYQLP